MTAGPALRIDVVTLFPNLFGPALTEGVLGRAVERGVVSVALHDLREHGLGRHRQVDDTPYGGGAGMVLRPEPLAAALAPIRADGVPVLLLDPAGERLTDGLARELAALPRFALVCGRYEGVDERVRAWVDREVSIGDYVLTGGELAGAGRDRRGQPPRARRHRPGLQRRRLVRHRPARASAVHPP